MQYQDLNQSESFLTYPTNCLVCVIDKAADVRSLIRELNQKGYGEDEVRILFSEEGARRLDPLGDQHGVARQTVPADGGRRPGVANHARVL